MAVLEERRVFTSENWGNPGYPPAVGGWASRDRWGKLERAGKFQHENAHAFSAISYESPVDFHVRLNQSLIDPDQTFHRDHDREKK